MTQIANRIVELQLALNAGVADTYSAQREQRQLWDTHYPNRPYDAIAHDADFWAFRKPDVRPVRRVVDAP